MRAAELELDLDVFAGPFDLLLTLVLREEVDLLEVDLADVVLTYLDFLEARGELDLEVATEFLVLIAALLELKSRLMLPRDEDEELDLEPGEAAEELLARMLDARRYRRAADELERRLAEEQDYRYRSAPLPKELRRHSLDHAPAGVYEASQLAMAIGGLLRHPPAVDISHLVAPRVGGRAALGPARAAAPRLVQLRRSRQALGPRDRRGDALRAARALQAGRGDLDPGGPLRRDRRQRPDRARARGAAGMSDALQRPLEALLFLSSEPVAIAELAEAVAAPEAEVAEALDALERSCEEQGRGIVLKRVAGGFALASTPEAEDAARRLFAKPRTPPLTPAQAETLAIVAYLQPVSRPEIARIRGVASESAAATLHERGLIEEAGRSRFGAVLYRTTDLFLRLFGLESVRDLPDPSEWDPTPEEAGELRERLLKAGEARAGTLTQAAPQPAVDR